VCSWLLCDAVCGMHSMAVLAGIGGIMGYAKAKSIISITAGALFAGSFILSGRLIEQGNDFKGHQIAAATSVMLSLVMLRRAVTTKKFVSAGLVTTAGVASSIYHITKSVQLGIDQKKANEEARARKAKLEYRTTA